MRSIEEVKKHFPEIEFNEQYERVFDLIENTESHLNIIGEGGSGKAQPVDTVIPTPDGYRKLGDLKVSDYVFDRNGKPTKVLGVFPKGKLPLYKVKLADGRETYCNDEHLWTVYTSKGHFKTLTLREMIDKGITKEYRSNRQSRYKIPTHSAVDFDIPYKLPVDPYVMGAFIGNGCNLEKQLSLSSDDEFVVSECARLLGMEYFKISEYNYTWQFKKNGIKPKTLDVFSGFEKEVCVKSIYKRIPELYKFTSRADRLSLLQGLFDTDGTIGNNDRCNVRYSTMSLGLANDIREVLLSLGYVSTIQINNRESEDKGIEYTVLVNIPNSEKGNLFRLPRKLDRVKTHKKRRNYDKVCIREVIPMNEEAEMVCIKVDNDEELYLTNDYIVTHNTTLLRAVKYALSYDSNVVVCATTGVASALLNSDYPDIKAVTLHSALKIKPQDIYSNTDDIVNDYIDPNTMELIQSMDYLIIDECSMLSCSLFDYLMAKIRYVRARAGMGIPRLILFGDIMQLPPVIKNDPQITKYYNEIYKGKHYYFNSYFYQDNDFVTVCLKKNYRQNKDESFKDILNRVRVGKVTEKDLKILNARVVDDCEWYADHEDNLRICTTVKDVAMHNKIALDILDGEVYKFGALITGEFRNSQEYKSGNYPDCIELKVGCPVMITKNDTSDEKAFVNGDMGTLVSCDTERHIAEVRLSGEDGDRIVEVPNFKTEIYSYSVDKTNDNRATVDAVPIGTYTNIAVKVCASSTVHKCQGLTIKGYGYFDKGKRNGWIPESGMYVALSRFQSLDHIGLAYPIMRSDIKVNKEAMDFLKSVE